MKLFNNAQFPRPLVAVFILVLVGIPFNIFIIATDAGPIWRIIGQFWTLYVFLGLAAYIVFWDSKKRWPDKTAFQRWTNLITFKRD